MAVTHIVAVGREQCFQQIERLTKSHSLHSSESLCKLLRYLAEQSLDHPGIALKEYQIATEVLGRPAGFDPQSDSTVRVQAGRLRVKLAEHYAHEGATDPIVVEIPKGSYALTFHMRPAAPGIQVGVWSLQSRVGNRRGGAGGLACRLPGYVCGPAIAAHSHTSRNHTTGPGRLSAFLESLRDEPAAALGYL